MEQLLRISGGVSKLALFFLLILGSGSKHVESSLMYTKLEDGIIKGIPENFNMDGITNNHKAIWWRNQVWYLGTKAVVNPSREGSEANYEARVKITSFKHFIMNV